MNHQKQDTAEDSPFEQVRRAEDRESARVEAAKKKYEDATLEKLRVIDAKKMTEGDALRTALSEKLTNATATETAAMMSEAQKHAEQDVATLDAQATKNRKKTEDDLLRKALDITLLAR